MFTGTCHKKRVAEVFPVIFLMSDVLFLSSYDLHFNELWMSFHEDKKI